jgi:hypothetical protein
MKVILQKAVVCTKFDIYGFLFLFFYFLNSTLIIDSHILYLFVCSWNLYIINIQK